MIKFQNILNKTNIIKENLKYKSYEEPAGLNQKEEIYEEGPLYPPKKFKVISIFLVSLNAYERRID